MDQLLRLFSSLTLRQKISFAVAILVVAGGLSAFLHWTTERDFQVLFSEMSAEDASAVVAKLKESGAEYRLGPSGNAILVRTAKVADLRLQMAGAGLPKTGRVGFELFDKNNFGATEFAEQVNYHRALEGELERSVMALAEVEQARIHLTQPKESLFLENRRPAKASVLVKLKPGAQLSPGNVQAVTHLIASAVEGLQPEMVSVIDDRGNLLNRPRRPEAEGEDAPSDSSLDYRRSIERDLLTKINSTLEPLLGPDKFRAGVSVECDFTSGDQSEETFDPSRSVMTTSQRTEDLSGGAQSNGVPGTASNLPRPTSRPGSSAQGVSRRTENVAYESSRVVKRTRLPQGALKRISIAVLLDHTVRWEGSGNKARRIVEPPSPERLKATRELIAGVTGLQPDRGDQLTVESLPFESTLAPDQQPPPAPAAPASPSLPLPSWLTDAIAKKNMIVLGAIAAVTLIVFLGGAFFLFTRSRRKSGTKAQAAQAVPALAESDLNNKIEAQLANQLASRQRQEQEILSSLNIKLPSATSKKTEVLIKQLSEESKKDVTTLPQVVRTWISELDN